MSLVARRFCLVDLADSRWRKPGVRRMSLPVPDNLKRLAMDFLVFCMGGVVKTIEWGTPWQGEKRPAVREGGKGPGSRAWSLVNI